MEITSAAGVSGLWGGGTAGPVRASAFVIPGAPTFFCPSLTVSGTFAESLRGRPLLRLGESGGFLSSLGEVGCAGVATALPDSGNLGGVFGGRPLFLFRGVTRELTLDSAEVKAASLPGVGSVFLDWLPPLPLPRCCCCSPSWAAMRDSVSNLRRTGRFLSTGMSGDKWGGEYGG